VQRNTSDWGVGTAARAMPSATQVVCARTVDSAVEALSGAYSDVTVRLPATGSGLRMQLTTRTLPNVVLGDLNLTRSIVRSARYPWFAICLPGSGKVGISTNRASALVAGNQGAIVTPGDPVQVDYLSERCLMHTVLFDRTSLEAELAMMLGRTVTGLPAGVTASAGGYNNAAFGLGGAATAAGTYPFTVTLSDSSQPQQTVTGHYTLIVRQG